MRRVAGTGRIADRAAFAGTIAIVAPRVLTELAAVLDGWLPQGRRPRGDELLDACPAPALTEVRDWARKWNLAREESGVPRGQWILEMAVKTLWVWAEYCAHVPRERLHERGFSGPPSAAWRQTGGAIPIGTSRDGVRRTGLKDNERGGWADAWSHSRYKRAMGGGNELLRTIPTHHLVAFVHWQVLGEGVDRVGRRWAKAEGRKVPPTAATCLARMRAICSTLDLPSRPKAKAGRPRLVSDLS